MKLLNRPVIYFVGSRVADPTNLPRRSFLVDAASPFSGPVAGSRLAARAPIWWDDGTVMSPDDGPDADDLARFGGDTAFCPDCGAELWDQAEVCPACSSLVGGRMIGRRGRRFRRARTWITVIAIVCLAALIATVLL